MSWSTMPRNSNYLDDEPRRTVGFQKPISKALEFQNRDLDEIDIMRSDNKGIKGFSLVESKGSTGMISSASASQLSGQKGGKPPSSGKRDTHSKGNNQVSVTVTQSQSVKHLPVKSMLGEMSLFNSKLPDERSLSKQYKAPNMKKNFNDHFADILSLGSQLPLGSRMEISHTHVGQDAETDQQGLEMLENEQINNVKSYEHDPMRPSVRSSSRGTYPSQGSPIRFIANLTPLKTINPNQGPQLHEIGGLSPINILNDVQDDRELIVQPEQNQKATIPEGKKSRESSQERVIESGDSFAIKLNQRVGVEKIEPRYVEENPKESQKKGDPVQPIKKEDGPDVPDDLRFTDKKMKNPKEIIQEAEAEEEHDYEQLLSSKQNQGEIRAFIKVDVQPSVEVQSKKRKGEVEKRSEKKDKEDASERQYEYFSSTSTEKPAEKPIILNTSANENMSTQKPTIIETSSNYNLSAQNYSTPREDKKYNYQPAGDTAKYQSAAKPSTADKGRTFETYSLSVAYSTPQEGKKSSYRPGADAYKSQNQGNSDTSLNYSAQKSSAPKTSARGKYTDPFGEGPSNGTGVGARAGADQNASFTANISGISLRTGQSKLEMSYQSPYINPYVKEPFQAEPGFNSVYQNPYRNPYESQAGTGYQRNYV